MSDFKFSRRDFPCHWANASRQDAADYANARLKEMLDASPTVETSGEGIWFEQDKHPSGQDVETHRAKLVQIEELVQEGAERKLLRELVTKVYDAPIGNCKLAMIAYVFADRAKRLLEKGQP